MDRNNVPKDPVMLYSYLNTKLRDQYSSFQALCEDMDLDPSAIEASLAAFGFEYNEEMNQFR